MSQQKNSEPTIVDTTPKVTGKRSSKRSSKQLVEGGDNSTKAPPVVAQKKRAKLGKFASVVEQNSYEREKHFYPRVLNATMHPLVASFMGLSNERIATRYCHLNPKTKKADLLKLLSTVPTHFRWGGSDLFNCTNIQGRKQMVVIETNSCPSGQKSFPAKSAVAGDDSDGYHILMKEVFKEMVEEQPNLPTGALAVIYDKNSMEASGYAAAMADEMKEDVYLAEFYEYDLDPPVRFEDGVMYLRKKDNSWIAIRACFRYVTQKPWNRIPVNSKTLVMNKIVSCLAGGRNKMLAATGYEFFNRVLEPTGLSIRIPETIRDCSKEAVGMWVRSMGGIAVIKNPYSNCGQGVYTITNEKELAVFEKDDHKGCDKFIVQALIGNAEWSSQQKTGVHYHTCTLPDKKLNRYVSDLRFMVVSSKAGGGFRPISIYARRAHIPLADKIDSSTDSWAMLGTNLSVKNEKADWDTETNRLYLMDNRDFNILGLGIDDLIDAYVQSVLSVLSVDNMACQLIPQEVKDDGSTGDTAFDRTLYTQLNSDPAHIEEILLHT